MRWSVRWRVGWRVKLSLDARRTVKDATITSPLYPACHNIVTLFTSDDEVEM